MTRNRLFRLAAGAAATLMLAGCGGGGDPLETDEGGGQSNPKTITVGSANFSENVLLAEMYAQALQAEGMQVNKKLNIGAREVYIPAVMDGSIDLMPEYTGNLLLHFDEKATETASDEVDAALHKALPDNLVALNKSEAVDEDALVVRRETAEKHNLETIADLKPIASDLVVGGSPEFRERKSGLKGLQEVYGLQFKEFKTLDVAGPITVEALKSGEVDVSQLFTTQSAIAENDFVVLDDPKHIHIAQNVVALVRKSKLNDTVEQVLNDISAELDTETLTELLRRVDVEHENAAAVAKDFLSKNGML